MKHEGHLSTVTHIYFWGITNIWHLSLPGLVDECQDYLVKFGIIMSEIGKM